MWCVILWYRGLWQLMRKLKSRVDLIYTFGELDDLYHRLNTFSEQWNSTKIDIYHAYDAAKSKL